MRSIRSYLPTPDPEKTEIIQARVSPQMKDKVFRIARQNKWSPSDVVRAGLMKFLDDEKPKQESFDLTAAS